MARFFVPGVHERGERVRFDAGDAHHIRDVLRLGTGDRVEVIDSAARAFVGQLETSEGGMVAALVEEREPAPASRLRVDIAQALPKGPKMDFIVEKATELGAGAVLPFTSERTIARDAGVQKLERWRRIARSAAEQSGRRSVPAILPPMGYAELLTRFCAYDVVLFPWESAEQTALRDRLPSLLRGAHSILVAIGPEGGFSRPEVEAARERGAEIVSLGPRILRTETAALVVLSVLAYEASEPETTQFRRIKEH
jgi:16S rRNA (uracil1498-N3)-methyltransferase